MNKNRRHKIPFDYYEYYSNKRRLPNILGAVFVAIGVVAYLVYSLIL